MKKATFLCLFVFLFASILFSQQITLINKTLSDKTSKTLYIGLENELEIQCETLKGIIPQSGVSLTQNKLSIKTNVIGKLTIVILTNHGEKPITFDVRVIPEPIPVVSGQPSKEIIKNLLSNQSHLSIKSRNNDDTFFDKYEITSFQATLNGIAYEVTGDRFSTELESAIIDAKNNDVLAITDIKSFNEEIKKSFKINGSFNFKIR